MKNNQLTRVLFFSIMATALIMGSCSKEADDPTTNPTTEQPISIDTVRGIVVHKNLIPAALRPTSGTKFFITEDLTISEVTDTNLVYLQSYGILTKKYKDRTVVDFETPFPVTYTGKCGVHQGGWYKFEVTKGGYTFDLLYPNYFRYIGTDSTDIGKIRTLTGVCKEEISKLGTIAGPPDMAVSKIE